MKFKIINTLIMIAALFSYSYTVDEYDVIENKEKDYKKNLLIKQIDN